MRPPACLGQSAFGGERLLAATEFWGNFFEGHLLVSGVQTMCPLSQTFWRASCFWILCFGTIVMSASESNVECWGQEANYDEALVPAYSLPEVLQDLNGESIRTIADWEKHRIHLIDQFATHMFGHRPTRGVDIETAVQHLSRDAMPGCVAKEVTLTLRPSGPREANARQQTLKLLLLLPDTEGPVPVFLGLNFQGNHTVCSHPEVSLPTGWVRSHDFEGGKENRASEAMRNTQVSRWPWEQVISEGYGIATMYYGDIDADYDDKFAGGVHQLLRGAEPSESKVGDPGVGAPADWGSISAWAWGLSRIMDYLETDSDVQADRVFVMGHSRLGKTALWAGATDPRFAMVISNNSGCGGAALSRRQFGETLAVINRVFPHWFNEKFKTYNHREQELPFDQHQLIAAIAPRPVYVTSASEDLWADPRGEFLSVKYASPVYELYGLPALSNATFPAPDTPLHSRVGYHCRTGKHDVTEYDWAQFMRFAKQQFSAP